MRLIILLWRLTEMEIVVALAGNPNSGKTTLFNELTGARQHVGNYPGVTVEKKEGVCSHAGHTIHFVDLPGTYSLTAYSEEEVVARDFLVEKRPAVINIVDASNLERNLYLTVQFFELGFPVVIALNMIDVAEQRGIRIDSERLSSLLGAPVAPIIARSGQGKQELLDATVKKSGDTSWRPLKISYGEDIDLALSELEDIIEQKEFMAGIYPSRWIGLKYLENDRQIVTQGREIDPETDSVLKGIVARVEAHLQKTLNTYPEAVIADYRYGFIRAVLKEGVLSFNREQDRLYLSDKIDRVLTNRFLGPLLMFVILFGLYTFTFSYSEAPVAWFGAFFNWMGGMIDGQLPDGHLKSLIVSGIIDGVGGVLGFVPIICFMFFGIAVLEDSGYLSRVAYMLDRVFRIFGLHGSSVMAFIISGGIAGGCAVPGVMATRTLRSRKERLATLLTVPYMNCGAKLPVLALMIAAFFSDNQTQLMFVFTLVSWGVALLVAKFLRLTVIRGPADPFVVELPPYRLPTFKGLFIHTWERTWQYIKKAGTVILAISILLWAMMTFPELPAEKVREFDAQRITITDRFDKDVVRELERPGEKKQLVGEARQLKEQLMALDAGEAGERLRFSFAGRIGTAMEGVTRLAGFEWRTNIALIGGFVAKEVIISTLGTAYSLGEVDSEPRGSLAATLARDPGWNPAVGLSLIVFTMFYAPCFVTVVCIAREAGSWKWGAFAVTFNTLLAFGLASLTFQIGSALM